MLINGEKFACEACIRGHRVSSCHHQGMAARLRKPAFEVNVTNQRLLDRPLVHVNKKGRPVSQCQHCRGLRKARSQHVHCECQQKGHSKDDCQHEKGDGKQGKAAKIFVRAPLTVLEPGTCCCQHTGKCTCALKKDHLEAVPEDITHMPQARESPKPRHLNMNSHESKATVFTNGHHKPVHKFNDAHNQLGAPYKVPSRSSTNPWTPRNRPTLSR